MEEKPDYVNVVVVSAHSPVREGIISILSGVDEIKVVGQVSNKLELMECIHKLNPYIAIVNDEDAKGISSLEAIRLINQIAAKTKVLLLIGEYDKDKELAALKMGVRGFLLERTGKADFIRCIKTINKGDLWVRREIMEKFIHQLLVLVPHITGTTYKGLPGKDYLSASMPSFSKRELEVIVLVIKGYRNKEIARNLSLTEKTVKHYLSNIFKKLSINKRADIR